MPSLSPSILTGFDTIHGRSLVRNQLTESALLEREIKRLERYREYWELYKGNHWSESELDTDGPTPVWNKTRTFIDKSITFLVGKPFKIGYLNEKIEKLLNPYIDLILDNSGGAEMFGLETAQMGSVSGDAFLKTVWDRQANFGKGGPKIQVLDSSDVRVRYEFVEYSNSIPDEAVIEYDFLDPGKGGISNRREIITPGQIEIFIDGVKDEGRSGPNLLGRVFLVHIRNMFVGKEPYGLSDCINTENLNKILNAAIRRFQKDVEFHGNPVTVVFGAKIDKLEKGEGKMWGNLPKDAKVENLELKTDLPAQQKFMRFLEEALAENMGVPIDSTKGTQGISNTSGTALQIQYLPLTELTARKKITYGTGFKQALMLALELGVLGEQAMKARNPAFEGSGIIQIKEEIEATIAKEKNPITKMKPWNWIEIDFQSFLPKDRLIELNVIEEELKMGLEDRAGAMKRLGKNNIEAKLRKIDAERKRLRETGAIPQITGREGTTAETGGKGAATRMGNNLSEGERAPSETPAGAAQEARDSEA